MEIREVAEDIHANAEDKGWWNNPSPDATQIALFHSELSEALECMRKDEPAEYFFDIYGDVITDMKKWNKEKTQGYATELIDCVIRIFDFLQYKDIDIEQVLWRKHEYNRTREYKHGKKF